MKEEQMKFKVIDENGKEIECEVLFTFESDETNKNYIVYTDNTTDEGGNTKVYASIVSWCEKCVFEIILDAVIAAV